MYQNKKRDNDFRICHTVPGRACTGEHSPGYYGWNTMKSSVTCMHDADTFTYALSSTFIRPNCSVSLFISFIYNQ